MKKIILLCLFAFLGTTSYSQENCKKFRTGKFENKDNGTVKATIQRNDSIQTEQYGDKEVKLKVQWINDCTYRLIFLEGNEAFWNSRPKDLSTPDLIVRITEVNGNKYLQESKFDIEDDFVYKSEITKLD